MRVLVIVENILAQAVAVCSYFIVIETPRFEDRFEDIVKDFFFIIYQAKVL